MTFRRTLTATMFAALAGLAVSASGTAEAGTRSGVPLFGSNSVTANNIAAGTGNHAQQNVFANQLSGGGGMMPWRGAPQLGGGGVPYLGGGGTNSVTANNIAAGVNNTAIQGIGAMQGPGGFNRVDATNLAAGEGNLATQQVLTSQR